MAAQKTTGVTLDPENEFEAALLDMVLMHREKGRHYGSEDDVYQNFYDNAEITGTDPLLACEVLLAKHASTIKQWRQRDPGQEHNKYTDDAHLDRAVYAVIALNLYNRQEAE